MKTKGGNYGSTVKSAKNGKKIGGDSGGANKSPSGYAPSNKSYPKQGGLLTTKNAYSTKSLERRLAHKKF